MTGILLVGLGGALGAIGRYGISLLPAKAVFPVWTFVTNVLGAVLIGFIVGASAARGAQDNFLLFWKTGVCGGFTTFSTFSLEALRLLEGKQYLCGGSYMLFSAVLCVAGVALGRAVALQLFRPGG